jgi:5-formyltetrahydrofolate cyclo-ligase
MALRRTASAAQLVDDLGVGSLVVDTSRQRLGRVMGFYGSRIHLRPPQGGLEWEVSPEYVRVARPEEIVSVPAQMRGRTP